MLSCLWIYLSIVEQFFLQLFLFNTVGCSNNKQFCTSILKLFLFKWQHPYPYVSKYIHCQIYISSSHFLFLTQYYHLHRLSFNSFKAHFFLFVSIIYTVCMHHPPLCTIWSFISCLPEREWWLLCDLWHICLQQSLFLGPGLLSCLVHSAKLPSLARGRYW